MKIYYAHHIYKYNTKVELYEIELIKKYLPDSEIINPNGYINQDDVDENIMKDCLNTIEKCDSLVFSSMNNVVGLGVYREINKALLGNIPIYYITEDQVIEVVNIDWNIINHSNRAYASPIINKRM